MTLSSIAILSGGSGYVTAPYVFISNDVLDPNGAFDPSNGGGAGFQLATGQWFSDSSFYVPTDPVAVFCSSSSSTFACRYTP